jgi:hypothetical protein
MKKVVMWTGIGVGAAIGTYYAIRGMRGHLKEGLGRVGRTAGAARSVLEATQSERSMVAGESHYFSWINSRKRAFAQICMRARSSGLAPGPSSFHAR